MGAKDTKIHMIVDTKHIQPGKEEEYVRFKDNRKNPEPKNDPANFTSEISAGEKVFWFGEPGEESRDSIEITGIRRKKEEEPDFLEDIGKDPSNKGAFKARVVGKYMDGVESYSVSFRIKGHSIEYEVDPKLKMEI